MNMIYNQEETRKVVTDIIKPNMSDSEKVQTIRKAMDNHG